jgi:hypothetical protein
MLVISCKINSERTLITNLAVVLPNISECLTQTCAFGTFTTLCMSLLIIISKSLSLNSKALAVTQEGDQNGLANHWRLLRELQL